MPNGSYSIDATGKHRSPSSGRPVISRYQVVKHPSAPARLPYAIKDNAKGGYVPGGSPILPRVFQTRAEAEAAIPRHDPTNGWGNHYNQSVHLRNLYSDQLARFRQKYPGHADDPKLVAKINTYDQQIEHMNAHRGPASPMAHSHAKMQQASGPRTDPTNGWGKTYTRTVHDRNLASQALSNWRSNPENKGRPDDPIRAGRVHMYDRRIEHMNSVSPSNENRANIAAARRAGVALPVWMGTIAALPGATIPGGKQGLGHVRNATVHAGLGMKQFATGVVTGGANAVTGTGDELMGDITGNGGYFRASQQHAKAINPNYANPGSYVHGRAPGVMADLAQSAAQNPSTLGLASTVGAGSGGWADQATGAAGLYAGGNARGAKKALANIPVSELHYIVTHPAQVGVNALLLALGGRGGVLEKAGAMEDEAMELSEKGGPANAERATQLMSQAAKLRDMVSVKVPRGAQGLVDRATRGFERSPVVRQTAAAAYDLNRFKNPLEAVKNAKNGNMPWDSGRGPVIFRPKEGSTPEQIEQYRAYVKGANEARRAGGLSPTGRVSTKGQLGKLASKAARAERARAKAAGTPYVGDAGHVTDTTWSGRPDPYSWLDLNPTVNRSLGGQSVQYEPGYRPTEFRFLEPGTPWAWRPQPLTLPNPIPVFVTGSIAGQMANKRQPPK